MLPVVEVCMHGHGVFQKDVCCLVDPCHCVVQFAALTPKTYELLNQFLLAPSCVNHIFPSTYVQVNIFSDFAAPSNSRKLQQV